MESIRALCARMQRNVITSQGQASPDRKAAAGFAILITVGGSVVFFFLLRLGWSPLRAQLPKRGDGPTF